MVCNDESEKEEVTGEPEDPEGVVEEEGPEEEECDEECDEECEEECEEEEEEEEEFAC